MQESPVSFNASDSLLNQSLPEYRRNFIDDSENKQYINQSGNNSSDQISKSMVNKRFEKTMFEKYYDQINEVKITFSKKRAQIIKDGKPVVSLKPNNHELRQTIKSRKQLMEDEKQTNQKLSQKLKADKEKNKLIKQEISAYEKIKEFEKTIRNLLKQDKICAQNEEQFSKEIINELSDNLNKRSQIALSRLKPYLQYSVNRLEEQNELFENTNNRLNKEGELYDKQKKKQTSYRDNQQIMRSVYEIEDQIENQIKYGQGLKRYSQRNDIDLKYKKNRFQV